jgi:hypothetical protein
VSQVFKVLWAELPGNSAEDMTVISDAKFQGEMIVTKIRWFVVVKEGPTFCSCLYVLESYHMKIVLSFSRPISTYAGRDVSESSIRKSDHAILHSSDSLPRIMDAENPEPGEKGMLDSIKVKPRRRMDKLFSLSRVNFGKVYTVEHNVKVFDFGDVDKKDLPVLTRNFQHVWMFQREKEQTGPDDDPDKKDKLKDSLGKATQGDEEDQWDDEEEEKEEEEEEEEDDGNDDDESD